MTSGATSAFISQKCFSEENNTLSDSCVRKEIVRNCQAPVDQPKVRFENCHEEEEEEEKAALPIRFNSSVKIAETLESVKKAENKRTVKVEVPTRKLKSVNIGATRQVYNDLIELDVSASQVVSRPSRSVTPRSRDPEPSLSDWARPLPSREYTVLLEQTPPAPPVQRLHRSSAQLLTKLLLHR